MGGACDGTASGMLNAWEPGHYSGKSWSFVSRARNGYVRGQEENEGEKTVPCSIQAPRNWMKPNYVGEDGCLHSFDGFKCCTLPGTSCQKYTLLISHKFNQHRDHEPRAPKWRLLLKIQELVLLALGMEWMLGWGILGKRFCFSVKWR